MQELLLESLIKKVFVARVTFEFLLAVSQVLRLMLLEFILSNAVELDSS